jgi:spermidine synthase
MKLWHTLLIALIFGGVLDFASKRSFEPVEAVSPDHAAMHFHLGKYQRLSGQPQKALESLQRALANQPQSFGIHAEIGNTHLRLGDKDNAAKHFQAALDLQPDHAESHCGLANLRLGENKHAEACQHYRAALKTEPDELSALNNLAWVLSTTTDETLRDGKAAIPPAEHAAELTERKQPVILMTLAAAYAAAGRFDDAISTAEAARQLAEASNNQALANTLNTHLAVYRSGNALK